MQVVQQECYRFLMMIYYITADWYNIALLSLLSCRGSLDEEADDSGDIFPNFKLNLWYQIQKLVQDIAAKELFDELLQFLGVLTVLQLCLYMADRSLEQLRLLFAVLLEHVREQVRQRDFLLIRHLQAGVVRLTQYIICSVFAAMLCSPDRSVS